MIKKSIRNKLFLYVTLIFASFVIAIFAFNSLLLPSFYLSQKKAVLEKQAEIINEYNVTSYEEYYDAIEEMTLNSGTELIVYDELGIVYESIMKRYGDLSSLPDETSEVPKGKFDKDATDKGKDGTGPKQFVKKMRWWETDNGTVVDENGIFISTTDPEMQVESLIYKLKLTSGDIVAIRIIVGAVEDSIQISNVFLLIISSVFLVLALVVTYYFSKRFTDPIIEMQRVTTKLSELDFTQSYKGESKDELGILGENINILSGELAKALNDLKMKNAQLMVELEKERQLDSLRRTFISNVSHELKTPLAIIESYAEGIQLGVAATSEKRKEYSEIIIAEISHMTSLLDSILDLSQIEAGVLKINNSNFSLKNQISKVIQAHEVMAQKKDCNLIFEADNAEDIIDADILRIQQVVRNYLKNAIIHAEEGTTVTIIEKITDDKVYVAVQNIGVQLKDSEIKNIWSQFYKKDTARTINRSMKQHGLGLSIVKGILDLYPDAAYGAKRLDNGMEFWFEFPREKE